MEAVQQTKHIKPKNTRPKWDKTKKYQHWCFTVQGWDEKLKEKLMLSPSFAYIILGKEIGDQNEGAHYQGFCSFENQRYHGSVKAILGGAWCEPAISTDASIQYCRKDGEYFESGEPILTSRRLEGMYDIIANLQGIQEVIQNKEVMSFTNEQLSDMSEDINTDLQEALLILDDILFELDETSEYLPPQEEYESDCMCDYDGIIDILPPLKRARTNL